MPNDSFINNLRFGDGALLKSGEGDSVEKTTGKTLRGRYIVRVGWDDVKGWMGEVKFHRKYFLYQYLDFVRVVL